MQTRHYPVQLRQIDAKTQAWSLEHLGGGGLQKRQQSGGQRGVGNVRAAHRAAFIDLVDHDDRIGDPSAEQRLGAFLHRLAYMKPRLYCAVSKPCSAAR